jgi:hypothetical protein
MRLEILAASILLLACLDYSATLNMEAMRSYGTSEKFSRTTWRHIPEDDSILHGKQRETFGSNRLLNFPAACVIFVLLGR